MTFGQVHEHSISGKTLDKDSVACFEAEDESSGRDKAFEMFGAKFARLYAGRLPSADFMGWFPRGIIDI